MTLEEKIKIINDMKKQEIVGIDLKENISRLYSNTILLSVLIFNMCNAELCSIIMKTIASYFEIDYQKFGIKICFKIKNNSSIDDIKNNIINCIEEMVLENVD